MDSQNRTVIKVKPKKTTPQPEQNRPDMTDESGSEYRSKLLASGQLLASTEELRFDDFGQLCLSASQVAAKRADMIASGKIISNNNYRPSFKPRFVRK